MGTGPRSRPVEHVLPADGAVRPRADGSAHWALVHVADIADLYLRALDGASAGMRYLGVAQTLPRRAIAEALALDPRLASARAQIELGWSPAHTDLSDGAENSACGCTPTCACSRIRSVPSDGACRCGPLPMPVCERRSIARPAAVAITVTAAPFVLWSALPLGASGATQSQVEGRIDRGKARESSLRSAAQRLGKLEAIAEKGVAVLQKRQADAQSELERWEAKLANTETRLDASRKRLASEQRRLRRDRTVLAGNLKATYQRGQADLATVVLESGGFADLLDRVQYESSLRQSNASILDHVKDAKARTQKIERSLNKIVPEQREETAAVRRERDAVAQRTAALEERKRALAEARAARLLALKSATKDRRRAERTLKRLIAQQEKASVDKSGPGGPWAIPWAIVQCESGGQNLPPNWAGASGYYQFMPATWKGMGGSTSDAYKATKAEQDRLAAKLWAGGAGARNWDCAAIVGLI
ncbi:MAG: transglycosylase family protein [Patulibacter minatonensis]